MKKLLFFSIFLTFFYYVSFDVYLRSIKNKKPLSHKEILIIKKQRLLTNKNKSEL